jgi:hypothetical protein
MKKRALVATIVAGCLYGQSVNAAPYTAKWEPQPGATTYRLYSSTDNGVSWQKIYEGTFVEVAIDVPTSGLTIIKVTAMQGAIELGRDDVGTWAWPAKQKFGGGLWIK